MIGSWRQLKITTVLSGTGLIAFKRTFSRRNVKGNRDRRSEAYVHKEKCERQVESGAPHIVISKEIAKEIEAAEVSGYKEIDLLPNENEGLSLKTLRVRSESKSDFRKVG